MDFTFFHMGVSLPLSLHYGDLQITSDGFDRMAELVPRMLAEPNQVPEALIKVNINALHWPYLLGKGRRWQQLSPISATHSATVGSGAAR